jgi:L-alanine-DL-glutamate epimerase-like enolase superfamily enzyme
LTEMVNEGRHLRRLRWGTRVATLVKPYQLSFTDITAFEVVWIIAEDDRRQIGIGEAVALPGYNWETGQTVRGAVGVICQDADGAAVSAIVQRCRDLRKQHPFAASAVMAALDMPRFLAHASSNARFPISAAISGDLPLAMLRQIVETQLGSGYNFLKVKVGRNLESDAAAARCVLTEWAGRQFRVVFDANQAHSIDAALAFAGVLRECSSERLQWYEQPVDRRDWEGMERLCRTSGVPIVLDECIYNEEDVERAAAIGAHGVKLKLIKNFGIVETLSLARLARKHGLIVVFGNGVASDIGNLSEYLTLAAAEGLFAMPSESSGFVKLGEPILGRILKIDSSGHFGCRVSAGVVDERIKEFVQVAIG